MARSKPKRSPSHVPHKSSHHTTSKVSHASHKSSSHHTISKALSKADHKLVENFGLSHLEFQRYKNLNIFNQTKIIDLLRERKRLNDYVKDYLHEKINQKFAVFMQIFFPSEHSLKYALQKVDEIEHTINGYLGNGVAIFDKNTTKKNRVEMLLDVAYAYQHTLYKKLDKAEKLVTKLDVIEGLEQKIHELTMIIDELSLQMKHDEYHIHDKRILMIQDSDLNYFLNKVKAIGINGFRPKLTKDQPIFFKISIIGAIYERFGSEDSSSKGQKTDWDQEENDDDHKPRKS